MIIRPLPLFDDDPGTRPKASKQPAKRIELKCNAARSRGKTSPRRVDEHSAAAACHTRPCVVVDLDDEIIEIILAPQPVGIRLRGNFHRPVVMPIGGVFTPAVVGVYPLRR